MVDKVDYYDESCISYVILIGFFWQMNTAIGLLDVHSKLNSCLVGDVWSNKYRRVSLQNLCWILWTVEKKHNSQIAPT